MAHGSCVRTSPRNRLDTAAIGPEGPPKCHLSPRAQHPVPSGSSIAAPSQRNTLDRRPLREPRQRAQRGAGLGASGCWRASRPTKLPASTPPAMAPLARRAFRGQSSRAPPPLSTATLGPPGPSPGSWVGPYHVWGGAPQGDPNLPARHIRPETIVDTPAPAPPSGRRSTSFSQSLVRREIVKHFRLLCDRSVEDPRDTSGNRYPGRGRGGAGRPTQGGPTGASRFRGKTLLLIEAPFSSLHSAFPPPTQNVCR